MAITTSALPSAMLDGKPAGSARSQTSAEMRAGSKAGFACTSERLRAPAAHPHERYRLGAVVERMDVQRRVAAGGEQRVRRVARPAAELDDHPPSGLIDQHALHWADARQLGRHPQAEVSGEPLQLQTHLGELGAEPRAILVHGVARVRVERIPVRRRRRVEGGCGRQPPAHASNVLEASFDTGIVRCLAIAASASLQRLDAVRRTAQTHASCSGPQAA